MYFFQKIKTTIIEIFFISEFKFELEFDLLNIKHKGVELEYINNQTKIALYVYLVNEQI